MALVQNTVKDLIALVLLAADGTLYTTSANCVVRLEDNGHADDGKFWDDDDDTWQASPVAWPSSTHTKAGLHLFQLPAAATLGHLGGRIFYTFTDNATEASATVACAGGEHIILRAELADLDARLDRNFDSTESQRGAHTGQMTEYFYVDPSGGDTIANGNDGSRDLPLDTVTEALSLVTDSMHSIIFLVAGAAAGTTTLTEAVTVNKRYTFIRGPGRDFIWTRSGAGDTISVTADGCEFSGFQCETAATGNGDGIAISGADFTRVHNVWFNATRGDGVSVSNSDHTQIHDCVFEGTGVGGSGQGIDIVAGGGTSSHTFIRRNHFSDVQGHSIQINSAGTDSIITGNEIHGSTGWGINLNTVSDCLIADNKFNNNSSGNIQDASGTNNAQINNQQWAKDSEIVPVALDGGGATLGGMLTKMADDNAGGTFDATAHSLVSISSLTAGSTPWARASVAYEDSTNQLRAQTSLHRGGSVVTSGLVATTITLRDSSDNSLGTATTTSFNTDGSSLLMTITPSTALTQNAVYTIAISIRDATGTVTASSHFATGPS